MDDPPVTLVEDGMTFLSREELNDYRDLQVQRQTEEDD